MKKEDKDRLDALNRSYKRGEKTLGFCPFSCQMCKTDCVAFVQARLLKCEGGYQTLEPYCRLVEK